ERQAVRLRAQIVHPLDERDHLLPFLLLARLLDTGMEVPDRRRRRENRFAIKLQDEPEHTMGAGVLRPHVDGHRLGADLGHQNPLSTSSQITCSSVRCTSWARAVDSDGTLM